MKFAIPLAALAALLAVVLAGCPASESETKEDTKKDDASKTTEPAAMTESVTLAVSGMT